MLEKGKVFLLKREISPYSGEDLFLGVYDNLKLANKQKEKYFESCKVQDKWKDQSYKEVNVENDVEIIEIQDKQTEEVFLKEGQKIYLVSEVFGQIIKKHIFISTNELEVRSFVQKKNEEDYKEDNIAVYYNEEALKLNVLSFPN
jgi:hypothetical protein